ncbi:MAG: hypothetical protein C4551_01935 [Bacillota bacterium]|nr:MAG: hypothetical protein C4551_01935 [Bacillota bacterium]
MARLYLVADLFCGAGGSSTGAEKAIRAIGGEMVLVAVNHWPVAVETHQKNHPTARHYIEDLNVADPEKIVPEGRLDLLMASPQCTYHSRARGGRPVGDQQRIDPWAVQRWLSKLDVRCLLVENVPEFVQWGPLLPNGKPDPKRKGEYFTAWLSAIWMMGYDAQWRMLNAADYGDATTRVRFFLQARRDGRPIRWPEATHSPSGEADMFGQRPRWRAAREVIDWANPGASLFERKTPLSPKTRLRIARGLQRFGGPLAPLYIRLLDLPEEDKERFLRPANGEASPFIAVGRENNVPKSVDHPLGTITTIPGMYLYEPVAQPFVFGNRSHNAPKDAGEPVPTITTAHGGGLCVVEPKAEPFVLGQQGGGAPRHTGEPLPTIATDGAIALIDPHLIKYYNSDGGGQSVEAPVPTILGNHHIALCRPLAVPYGPKAEARPVDEPLPTILTKDRLGVASPMIVPYYGEKNGSPRIPRSPDEPLATITTEPRFALCTPDATPFLVPQSHARSDDDHPGTGAPTGSRGRPVCPAGRVSLEMHQAGSLRTPDADSATAGGPASPEGVSQGDLLGGGETALDRRPHPSVDGTARPYPPGDGGRSHPRGEDRQPPGSSGACDTPGELATSVPLGTEEAERLPGPSNAPAGGQGAGKSLASAGAQLPTDRTGAGHLPNDSLQGTGFVVPYFGEAPGQSPRVHDVDEPLPTVTSHGAGALVAPVLVQTCHDGNNGRRLDEPLPTLTARGSLAIAEPVILPCGSAGAIDPRRLVLIDGVPHVLDIRFRMLTNVELARAMSFEDEEMRYEFVGTKSEITKQIGNAIPVRMAAALVQAILSEKGDCE